jgi:AraC-like DNA-binding protein
VACFYVLRRLHEQLRQAYSSVSVTEFKLAYFVLFGFSVHWLWAFFQYLAGNFLSDDVNDWVGNFEDFLIVLLVNGLLVLGLKNTRELLNISQPETIKPSEQSVDPGKVAQVETLVHEQKIYLENNINLDRFAEMAGLKPRELSLILHAHYKLNFFEFINGLRLEEAKRLLASPEHAGLSILDIIYKSGFNSQSAFQRFFKRVVGSTPSEYRRQALQQGQAGEASGDDEASAGPG